MAPHDKGVSNLTNFRVAEAHAMDCAWKDLIQQACRDLVLWKGVLCELVETEHLKTSLGVVEEPRKRLHGEYEEALLRLMMILDEMERIIASDTNQRAKITTGIAREISRLATLAQIKDALIRH